MPSKLFQPLLFDTFQYKYPNTTYSDEFKWKQIKAYYKRKLNASKALKKASSTSNRVFKVNNKAFVYDDVSLFISSNFGYNIA